MERPAPGHRAKREVKSVTGRPAPSRFTSHVSHVRHPAAVQNLKKRRPRSTMPPAMENALSELRTEAPGGTPAAARASSASRFTGRRIHFIGIGGSGMSGLARMLMDSGAIVTGSEPKPNAQTIELVKRGAQISRGQMGELLSRDIDLVVR